MERFPLEDLKESLKEIDKLIVEEKNVRQAAEKIYMIVESCIKILSEFKNLEEFKIANQHPKKNWSTGLLFSAAKKLSGISKKDPEKKYKIDESIWDIWEKAWLLHTLGFHENLLEIENIEKNAHIAKDIIEITKKVLKQ